MRNTFAIAFTATALCVLPAIAETTRGDELDSRQIAETVRGKRIYLAVPLGGEFPLYYQRDGRVDGSGEAVGLGRFMAPKDSGRWWIDGTQLCQKWTEWYNGEVFCFSLAKLPDGRLAWTRNDGMAGTARIGD